MKRLFKSKKGIAIIAVVAIVVVALVMRFTGSSNSSVPTGFVTVSTAEVRDLSETIALTGTIQGQGTTNITSIASAKFTEVNVAVGDQVEAGQVLAVLDAEDIETQIQEVSTNIGNANALKEIANAETINNIARAEYDRDASLRSAQTGVDRAYSNVDSLTMALGSDKAKLSKYNKLKAAMESAQAAYDAAAAAATENPADSALAQAKDDANAALTAATNDFNTYAATVDPTELAASIAKNNSLLSDANRAAADAQSAYDSAKVAADRTVDAAVSAYNQSKYASKDYTSQDLLKELKAQLADCTLKAPISGVVTSVKVSVGDKNTPGVAIITISDTNALVFSAMVDEKDIMKLEEKMAATLSTTAIDTPINGSITRIVRVKQPAADGGTSGYPVEITIDNHDLLLGMNAKARIVMKERKGILSVPYDHIQEDENGKKFVMVAVPSGEGDEVIYTATKKYVTVGEEINYYTEITGGELQEGDKTFYDSAVAEGDTVIVDDFSIIEE